MSKLIPFLLIFSSRSATIIDFVTGHSLNSLAEVFFVCARGRGGGGGGGGGDINFGSQMENKVSIPLHKNSTRAKISGVDNNEAAS